jgi:hypothetical protein
MKNGRSILAMEKGYMIATMTTLSIAITRFQNMTDMERIKEINILLGISEEPVREELSDWLPPGLKTKSHLSGYYGKRQSLRVSE